MPNRLQNAARNFLSRKTDYENHLLEAYLRGDRVNSNPLPDYGSIFSTNQNVYRDIPQMLQDPIISSALAVIMETAFQPTEDDSVVRVSSPFKKVSEELEAFHREFDMDTTLLSLGYNILVYGNVPIKMEYDTGLKFERFSFVPDFTKVQPIVISNRTLGFMYGGEFYDTYEFVYAQHLYYRDLGGIGRKQNIGGSVKGETVDKVRNEFVLAPSYLSSAVRPWRNVKIIEDALLLQRIDVSNYMRIIGVHVGDNVFSKNAVKLMNFYRQVFKKVRRVSYDGDGMSSSSFGNEFEVILPMTNSQNVDIKDIGGQVEVRALRDLEIQYKKLFSSLKILPSYIGFSDDSNALAGDSEGTTNRRDERFGRLVKALRLSTTKAAKKIDVNFLRSRGYDVDESDFSYNYVAASTVEDDERRETMKKYFTSISEMVSALEGAKVKFNADYLTKEVFAQALTSTSIDVDKLFDVDGKDREPQPVNSSLLNKEREKTVAILSEVGVLSKEAENTIKARLQITSSKIEEDALTYRKYLALGSTLASGKTVWLGDFVRQVSMPDKGRFKVSEKGAVLGPLHQVFTDSLDHSADNLSSGAIASIGDLYLVDGGCYLTGQDLYNYLYMLDQGVKGIPVQRVWTRKE